MEWWSGFREILSEAKLSWLKSTAEKGNEFDPVLMYESFQVVWTASNADELIDILLEKGSPESHFSLIHLSLMSKSARSGANGGANDEAQSNSGEHVDPEVLAERILQTKPEVLDVTKPTEPEKDMNLLHYALRYKAEKLIGTIIDLLEDKKVQDPEKLLGASCEQIDSPLVMMIKHNNVATFRAILRAVPTLKIESSVLSTAIGLQKQEIVLAFLELRSDCISDEVLRYSIAFGHKSMLEKILTKRKDVVTGCGILSFAACKGNEQAVRMLLDGFPDLAVEDTGVASPLHRLEQADIKAKLDNSTRQKMRALILPFFLRRANEESLPNASGDTNIIEQLRDSLPDLEDRRKEISLDLGGFQVGSFLRMIQASSRASSSIEQSETSLLAVDFETTLRLVDIPIPPFPESDTQSHSTPERLEASLILNWLRDCKKVTGIYELHVRDSLYLPHTEEAIAKCLKGFDVEVLDWMRVDMSIKPLIDTCPSLKKLKLYASNWATLSHWVSGDVYEQLSSLPKLEVVQIFILKDLIGSTQSSIYKKNCEAELLKSRQRLAGLTPHTNVDFVMDFIEEPWDKLINRHVEGPAIKSGTAVDVTGLGPFVQAYTKLQREFQKPDFLEETGAEAALPPVINVAIIDTGVDPDSIKCSEISGASFVSSGSGESPWWFSHYPHGTQMAKIITDIDPRCRLLVAKVSDSRMGMAVDSVTKAFRWATKSRADIISMSIALFKPDTELEIAVQQAIAAGIVVIASTAGDGHRQNEAYPADYPEVLKIAATDYFGNAMAESVKSSADFMFEGENITAKTSCLGLKNPTDKVSGTSAATAIAAGVASLILACHRLSLSTKSNSQSWQDHKNLKRKLVKNTFSEMVDNNGAKFVKPWLFFAEPTGEGKWGDPTSTLSTLARKEFPI